jgi:hypothetical protein
MCGIHMREIQIQIQIQAILWKTCLATERSLIRRGRVKEGGQEGEYGWCTFYTGMNIEFLYLLKSPLEGD